MAGEGLLPAGRPYGWWRVRVAAVVGLKIGFPGPVDPIMET